MPLVPILSVLASFYLMLNLPGATWLRFAVWMVVGLVVYFAYGRAAAGSTHRAGGRTPPPRTRRDAPEPSPPRVRNPGGPFESHAEHAELTCMAISVLDVRDTFAARASPRRRVRRSARPPRRRPAGSR